MMKNTIAEALRKALEAEDITDVAIQVTAPSDEKYGDYTSNVAMIAAKKIGKNPLEVAEGLQGTLSEMAVEGVRKIEVVKPGFLNFWLDQEFIIAQLNQKFQEYQTRSVIELKGDTFAAKKIMVEFTDPNPFKEFHIGHLYSNIVGESLARLFESQGDEVRRVCYQGDVGLHVAKALYGITRITNYELRMKELEKSSLEERAKFLGECYAVGAKVYEESEEAKKEIHTINKQVYEKDPEIMPLYEKGRAWSLEYFETIYKRLGTKFTGYYFESEVGEIGKALVKQHIGKVFEESDGAVVFRGEPYGLHTRVFINALGLPTYEAKELGLAPKKYQDFPYDLSVIVTGNEINEYFKVLLKALSLIDSQLAGKTRHISHGMLRLPEGKMSSRSGNILTGEWLLDEAKSRIQKAYPDMDKETAEKVAIGSVKYALLKSSIGKNIEFSFDESISFEGNSGPYLQYTYVRTQSILRKSQATNPKSQENTKYLLNPFHDDLNDEERGLLRTLFKFDEVVALAAQDLAPSHVATYLFDLAQKFNNFYQKHKILESEQKVFRIGLTVVVGETIKKGLDLLGIPVPERM